MAGTLGAFWGVAGFSAVLIDAINRLSGIVAEGFADGLHAGYWLLTAVVVVLMAYVEGYRGFQRSFSPRTAARIYYLYQNPDWASVLLAPLFCIGFFRAEQRTFLFAWVGTTIIVGFVIALHFMPQPWRGIVDAGVVAGLSWGLASFLVYVWLAFRHQRYPASPEVPGRDMAPHEMLNASAGV